MQRVATREVAQDLRRSGFVPGGKRVHRVEVALLGPFPIRGKAERVEAFSSSLGQKLRRPREATCS